MAVVFAVAADAVAWSPSSLNPDLWMEVGRSNVYLGTSGAGGVAGDGQSVQSIQNLGTSGWINYATVAGIYHAGSGKPYISLAGTGNYVHSSINNQDSPHTIAIACRVTTHNSTYTGLFATGGTGEMLLSEMAVGPWGTYYSSDIESGTTLSTSTSYTLIMTGPAGGTFYTNGVSDGTYSLTYGQGSGHIGGNQAGQFFVGNIYAVIYVKSQLSAGDITNLHNYLRALMP